MNKKPLLWGLKYNTKELFPYFLLVVTHVFNPTMLLLDCIQLELTSYIRLCII